MACLEAGAGGVDVLLPATAGSAAGRFLLAEATTRGRRCFGFTSGFTPGFFFLRGAFTGCGVDPAGDVDVEMPFIVISQPAEFRVVRFRFQVMAEDIPTWTLSKGSATSPHGTAIDFSNQREIFHDIEQILLRGNGGCGGSRYRS